MTRITIYTNSEEHQFIVNMERRKVYNQINFSEELGKTCHVLDTQGRDVYINVSKADFIILEDVLEGEE